MRVERDFEEIYRTQDDPWSIGAADDERYDLYRNALLQEARGRGAMLDIGCGFGAFLARFAGDFDSLTGLELTEIAVAKGRERFPRIEFVRGSADALEQAGLEDRRFDAIVLSDVIYYLSDAGKRRALDWIARHLAPGGVAMVAGWCPGGRYLEPDELARLVDRSFAVRRELFLERSKHLLLLAQAKRTLVALTVDYETWQPIPEGRRIDWDADVFEPTASLLDAADRRGAKVTLFAELGEYFWLLENEPGLAQQMEEQWRDAVGRGHDVQPHLHPAWLPELGARLDDGEWSWPSEYGRAEDYPGDLGALIAGCKQTLEQALLPVDPAYRVTAFRAGAYEAQPFARLHDALLQNGIACDSSVYRGGPREGRTFDYSHAASAHQPWFASRFDPQFEAPPGEQEMLELPIQTFATDQRWSFDSTEGHEFAQRFLEFREEPADPRSSEAHRLRKRAARKLQALQQALPGRLAGLVPGAAATEPGRRRFAGHDYHVLIGHSKSDLDIAAIERGVETIQRGSDAEFVTFSQMAELARDDVRLTRARPFYRVRAAPRAAVPAASAVAPLDRERLLVVADDADAGAPQPWQRIERVSADELIRRAGGDAARGAADADCICVTSGLERMADPDSLLFAAFAALPAGGCLALAVWSDGLGADLACAEHLWRTAGGEIAARLRAAGFGSVRVSEVDSRALGVAPHPPARGRITVAQGWKRSADPAPEERARELAAWAYRRLDPAKSHEAPTMLEVLAEGYAWCAGYNLVTGQLLEREGYQVRWVSMRAENHPRGRGDNQVDSHEVLLVRFDGRERVLDPMANVLFEAGLAELLEDPSLADSERARDERYSERGYDLYATSFWYERVSEVAIRDAPRGEPVFQPVADFLATAMISSRQDSKRRIGHS